MAKKTKISFNQILFRLVAGLVFSIIIFLTTMKGIEAGTGAILTNANNMSALIQFCSDFASSKAKDIQEKKQIYVQCTREKLSAPKK